NAPALLRTPSGWLALSQRNMGQGRVVGEWQSALYRSLDGVRWHALPLAPGRSELSVMDMAYGDGRYVVTGRTYGDEHKGVFLVSTDGEAWQQIDQPDLDATRILGPVEFAGGKFFAFGFGVLAVSDDAHNWTLLSSDILQFGSAAFGNGRYVLAGNGPMLVSEDGLNWASYAVSCVVPGACIADPSGNVSQSYQSHLRFVDGYFYSDQMRSADGTSWEALPERTPAALESGRFIGGGGYSLNV